MSMSELLITGGRGLLARRVVDGLRVAHRSVRVLSRSGHPVTVRVTCSRERASNGRCRIITDSASRSGAARAESVATNVP